jgi:hypothetical protein
MTPAWIGIAAAARAGVRAGSRPLRHLSPARHPRIWLAVVIVRAMLVTPAPFAAETPAPAAKPAAPRPVPAQSIVADDVLIEGKLYSPQALYIVSRNLEPFDRAAIVPAYLVIEPSPAFVPYCVRPELLGRISVSPRTAASDSTAVSP